MDHRRRGALHAAIDPLIELADRSIYILAAVFFLIAAAVLGVHAVIVFVQHLDQPPQNQDVQQTVVDFINSLLLVLIILEVLGTVRDYLRHGTTSLKPFLYIGIISATRRILAIGAESAGATGRELTNDTFRRLMIDLGVNGAVVLALALEVYLLGRGGSDAPLPETTDTEPAQSA
jgi:uncharacterized membrane protein (DUF373 family)